MPSRSLHFVWAFLDFALMAAGGILIALSIVWRAPDLIRNLIITPYDLTAGLALGIMFEISFLISIFAITQRKSLVLGFRILNVSLIIDSIACIVVGSMIWFYTLQERANFQVVWNAQTQTTQQQLQDHFSCCGYFNGTNIAVGGSFCPDITTAASQPGCITAITGVADYTLNNTFTTIYGFISITLCLLLASVCQINGRIEDERFRRIDEKRGHRGFV